MEHTRGDRSLPVRRRYSWTLLAWALGVLGPPLAAAAVVALEASTRCQAESVDCSWGMEALLILPVLFVSLVTVGPWVVYAALSRGRDPLAGTTALWALLLVVPSVPLVWLTGGAVFLVVPPLGGRYIALRRHVAAGGETSTDLVPLDVPSTRRGAEADDRQIERANGGWVA